MRGIPHLLAVEPIRGATDSRDSADGVLELGSFNVGRTWR